MAASDLVLSIISFPQNWDGTNLSLNVLLLPASDPTQKLTPAGPAFAGTTYLLEAVVIPGTENPPTDGAAGSQPFPITTTAPANSGALFTKLKTVYAPKVIPLKGVGPAVRIKKALPDSYTGAFPFVSGGQDFFAVGDEFGCALRAQTPQTTVPPPSKDIAWGHIISLALRQPKLAAALGMVYTATIAPNKTLLATGGWLYVRFRAATNPYAADMAANPGKILIQYFAARLPALSAARPLFAPVLYPLFGGVPNPAVYDAATLESEAYDDGFAKIVHTNQPKSSDAPTEDHNELTPASDAGVQLGWDDEQVAIWMNRQLDSVRSNASNNLPLGVLGYRVDVRKKGAVKWQSLCEAKATIKFDPSIDGTVNVEPPVEPTPARPLNDPGHAWLPRYLAQWRGKSLVVGDDIPLQLTGGSRSPTLLSSRVPSGLLRYGNTYEFRVRLADLTHGGPDAKGQPGNAAQAPIGACKFQRWIKPRAFRTKFVRDAASKQTLTQINIWRPILGYPELLFAGVPDTAVAEMIAQVPAAQAANTPVGANDPDVETVRVVVEARAPAHDATAPDQLDGPYRVIYKFDAPLPPPPADRVPPVTPNPAQALVINLQYQDVANIADLAAPAPGIPLTLPLPRARDVRIRLIPIAQNANPDYFGLPEVQEGLAVHFDTRDDRGVEKDLFAPTQPLFQQAKAILLQPGDDTAQRLALALDLQTNGLTISGRRGQRVVFGASGALRNTISGDGGQITFGSTSDLLGHWVVALQLVLNRDWTWDGFAGDGLSVFRDGKSSGTMRIPHSVGSLATGEALNPATQRDSTLLVFFDAVDPNPPVTAGTPNPFPIAPAPVWTVKPIFIPGLSTPDPAKVLPLHLPKAAPPSQGPRIASAGLALSPYQPSPDYSSTAPRRKALWIEFTQPVLDPADAYFARVLAYAPDPLLVEGRSAGQLADTIEAPDAQLVIDPEPIRVIIPNQGADTAGLEAMQQLLPASEANPRHFILPLPDGLTENSPELFGFFTYEFRVGHTGNGLDHWSTAQARYGRPLRVTGVQHPAPLLKCLVARKNEGVFVTAPFATSIRNGQTLPASHVPNTQLWALLYAQVKQADGDGFRNVLLAARQLAKQESVHKFPPQFSRDTYGFAEFTQRDDPSLIGTKPPRGQGIDTLLAGLSLPRQSPLSVLTVEMMPQYSDLANNPVDADLGKLRILRTSPLVPVPPIC